MKLIKPIKITSLSLFVFTLALVVLNQIDQELDPELKGIIEKSDPVIEDTENAFFAYTGFYAQDGMDISRVGKQIIEEYEISKSANKQLGFTGRELLGETPLEVDDDGTPVCDGAENRTYCLEAIRKAGSKVQAEIEKHDVLIQRYHSLYKFSHFQATSTHLPVTPFSTHRYVVLDIATSWINGERELAINKLVDDILFHRMIGRETRLLINKMIAIAALNRDYGLLHDFIRECAKCVLADRRIQAVLSGLDEDLLLSSRVMEGEIRWAYITIMELLDSAASKYEFFSQAARWGVGKKPNKTWHGLLSYFTLVNATINQGFQHVQKPNLVLSGYSYKKYEEKLDDILNEHGDDDYSWWEYLYNPGGKYLSSLYENDTIYSHYFEWPFMLEARIRLIRMQLQILQHDLKVTEIPGFLSKQPVGNQDPYTEAPIRYDKHEHSIYVIPFSREEDRIVVYL